MKSPSSRREAKSPSDGSLPYQPGVPAPVVIADLEGPRAAELLHLAQAERVRDAARRHLDPRALAVEVERHDEALGLGSRLDVEAIEHAEQRPRTVERQH